MIDLSVCVAGIRPENWPKFCSQIERSAHPYKVEIIFCGPYPPKPDHNVKWIKSFRAPTACVQQAIDNAKGQLICWLSDDAEILEDSLKCAIQTFLQASIRTQVVLPYYEGDNVNRGSLQTQPLDYWSASYHGSLRLPGIPQDYKIALCGMMPRFYFQELGGFDCRFEHINMSCIDLSCRVQNSGGYVEIAPKYVMDCEFSHQIVDGRCDCILCEAYVQNDLPLFQSIYSNSQATSRTKIATNLHQAPLEWRRFTR